MLVDMSNLTPKQEILTHWYVDLLKFKASVDKVVGDVAEDYVVVCHKWDLHNKVNLV